MKATVGIPEATIDKKTKAALTRLRNEVARKDRQILELCAQLRSDEYTADRFRRIIELLKEELL